MKIKKYKCPGCKTHLKLKYYPAIIPHPDDSEVPAMQRVYSEAPELYRFKCKHCEIKGKKRITEKKALKSFVKAWVKNIEVIKVIRKMES